MPDRVVLVGFMGAGKSTVGGILSRLLGWAFLDMDEQIEKRCGRSVADIFRLEGEAVFRDEEKKVALEASTLPRTVVASGGGAFASPDVREILGRNAVTFWLRCDFETLVERVGLGASRPLASDRERMRQLYSVREPSYRLADRTIEASGIPAEEVARVIVSELERFRGERPGH